MNNTQRVKIIIIIIIIILIIIIICDFRIHADQTRAKKLYLLMINEKRELAG